MYRKAWAIGLMLCIGQLPTVTSRAQSLQEADRQLGIHRTKGQTIIIKEPYSKLRRAWWGFLKKVGTVRIHRKYWEIHTLHDGLLYAHIVKGQAQAELYLGVEQLLPERQAKKYVQEIRTLLQLFTTLVHKNKLVTELKACEKALARKSIRWDALYKEENASAQDAHRMQADIDALVATHTSILTRLSQL